MMIGGGTFAHEEAQGADRLTPDVKCEVDLDW